MSETDSNPTSTLLGEALRAALKDIVKEAVQETIGHNGRETTLLTPEELADRLRIPISWVYEQSRLGNIPKHTFGRYIRFNLQEVIDSQKKD